jgi:hypothetical protein
VSTAGLLKAELVRELRLNGFTSVCAEKGLLQGEDQVLVDVYGERNGVLIIEIEERRRAPLHNVAKVMRWVSRSRRASKVTMVHVFSQEFYEKKEHRGDEALATFLGKLGHEVLNGRFEYIPMHVSMVVNSRSGPVRVMVKEIAGRIVAAISPGQPRKLA